MTSSAVDVLALLAATLPTRDAAGPSIHSLAELHHAERHIEAEGLGSTGPGSRAGDRLTTIAWLAARTDRLGLAFVAGYRAAVRALVPPLTIGTRGVLAATESGGAHPRAIATALVPVDAREDRAGEALGDGAAAREGRFVLVGEKTYVTLAKDSDVLVVIAKRGTHADGRPQLAAVIVPASAPGLGVHEGPPPPFAPEIDHARVTFDRTPVAASALLPGDGYDDYLKPFRSIEDAHVLVGALAYVTALARRTPGTDRAFAERASALLCAAASLAAAPPKAALVHIALSGLVSEAAHVFDEVAARMPASDERARLERDRPLLSLASRVRGARTETAWSAVDGGARGER